MGDGRPKSPKKWRPARETVLGAPAVTPKGPRANPKPALVSRDEDRSDGKSRSRAGPLRSRPARLTQVGLPTREGASRVAQVGGRVRCRAVVIGISTGGPSLLYELIPKLEAPLSFPILVVQHMPSPFTARLAERLNTLSSVEVKEAESLERVRAGVVYVARGGYHMEVNGFGGQARISLNQDPPEHACRPAADVLFRSAAQVYGRGLLAFILTGMGGDGTPGAREIKKKGGRVFVQTLDSCVVQSMPRSALQSGVAERALSPNEIVSLLNSHP